ncbi:MAG: ROK family protein [Chloroflexota bacterium]
MSGHNGSAASAEVALGIDVGGTKIAAGLVTREGRIVHSLVRPTEPETGRQAVLARMLEMAAELIQAGGRTVAAGIGTAGQVDPATGTIMDASRHLPPDWAGTRLGQIVEDALQVPVRVTNDGHAMALGELRFGAARRARNALGVTLGTGIGGGVIVDGELFTGSYGVGGLIGHVMFRYPGRRCRCGGRGHLEAYVSGPRIERRFRQLGGTGDVFAAAGAGDPAAERAVDEAADHLAAGLGGLANVFAPELIVLGGGVVDACPVFIGRLSAAFGAHVMPVIHRRLELVPAQLGGLAGMVGAAVAGFQTLDGRSAASNTLPSHGVNTLDATNASQAETQA